MNEYFFDRLEVTGVMKKRILECKKYIENNDMLNLDLGIHEIEGSNLFVNVVSFKTSSQETRNWEAHKQYVDLHYMISGEEEIQINDIANMEIGMYVENDDYLPANGNPRIFVKMYEENLCLCYPNDVHKVGIAINEMIQIKKAIFKIKID